MSPATASKRDKKSKNREKSPVIDLTTDEETDHVIGMVEDESPLRNATTRSRKDLPTHSGSSEILLKNSEPLDSKSISAEPRNMANPMLAPLKSCVDLNLSPIKKMAPPVVSPRKIILIPVFLSSPTKRRRIVTFSDNVVDMPSSPLAETDITPRKPILKSVTETEESSPMDPNNAAMWMKTTHSILHLFSTEIHSPSNPAFWQPGTIIQLESRSNDLPQLVDGCMEVLRNETFPRKFEVYATLNQVCKLNDANTLAELFAGEVSNWSGNVEKTTGYKPKPNSDYIKDICKFVHRDIEAIEKKLFSSPKPNLSPTRNDPFQSRTLSQALKLVSYLLASPSVNSCIPVIDIKWLYTHACELIVKPTISKSLVLPYLSIIKDCHFSAKKRRLIFESMPNPILEQMLFALLNIRNFTSSSLVNEKFIALKNMVQNFPAMMAKNFHHWFGGLVLNLCDLSFPLYTKVVSMGITALLEAARNYLDSNDICLVGRKFLESPLPMDQKSFATENLLSISTMPLTLTIDYVTDSLKDLIHHGHFKFAMDIWVGLTLLCGGFENGMENWKHLTSWLQVHKYCFNEAAVYAKVTALSSWKVIIYKICCCDLRDLGNYLPNEQHKETGAIVTPNTKQQMRLDEILRPKIKLLIHVFINITSVEFQREIIDALHHSFLSILYNILSYQPRTTAKYLYLYWDKIIQPVLINFYFKKDYSNAHMHHLGLGIFNRLIKPATPVNEKSFSSIRCLSNETVSLNEINSLNPRWVYLRFEKIMQIMVINFKLEKLELHAKLNCFNSFLNTLKFATKKEVHLSDSTYDLIDSIPFALQVLFVHHKVSYDTLFKLIVNLNDTFGAANLITDGEETQNVFEVILSHTMNTLTSQQMNAILSMLHGAIGERKSLLFIFQLVRMSKTNASEDLDNFIGDFLNSKKFARLSSSDMILASRMFEILDKNFAGIAKKLIQHIVLLKADEFERMVSQLRISEWNIQIFKFFVTLMHDAPYEHLKQASLSLISSKWQKQSDFKELFHLLLEGNFEFEVTSLRHEMVQNLKSIPDLTSAWMLHLEKFEGEDSVLDQLLCSTFESDLDVLALVKNRWEQFPLLKKAWLSKHGSLYKDPDCPYREQSHEPSDSDIDAKQGELESLLESAFEIHKDSEKRTEELGSEKEQTKKNPGSVLDQASEDTGERKEQNIVLPSEADLGSNKGSGEFEIHKFTDINNSKRTEITPPVTRRRSRRRAAKTPAAANKHAKIIEISSDDQPAIEALVPSSEVTKNAVVDARDQNDLEDAILEVEKENCSLEKVHDSDIIDDSAESEPKNGKRKAPPSTSQNTKRKRQDETDVKQVSDSDESAKNKLTREATVGPRVEIISDEKKPQDDSVNSIPSFNNRSFQGQSTAVNTSNESEEGSSYAQAKDSADEAEISSLSKRELSVVEERPHLESEVDRVPVEMGASHLQHILENMQDTELAKMELAERHHLETQLMQFILRMRQVPTVTKHS